MSRVLIAHRIAHGASIQDKGRPGYLGQGLSVSGALDRAALAEGAALLSQPGTCAALELPGTGGEFEAGTDIRIALTGAPMRATLEGRALAWNASHLLPRGARLAIGAAQTGVFGYLHVGGGFATPLQLGSRSSHPGAGLGTLVQPGARLPIGPDPRPLGETGLALAPEDRFHGGPVRLVRAPQTGLFAPGEIARFEATPFQRDPRSNRMGARLASEGDGFHTDSGLAILSEVIRPGDIQITGDGTPFVLLHDCQTTGGYPRIASVLPADLARVAQAGPGAALHFCFLPMAEALAAERAALDALDRLPGKRYPLVRDPRDIPDLLSYRLIGGATAGDDLERTEP